MEFVALGALLLGTCVALMVVDCILVQIWIIDIAHITRSNRIAHGVLGPSEAVCGYYSLKHTYM